jgi:transposase
MVKNSTNRENYEGKRVFVGLDVHKKHYSVTCMVEKVVVKRATMRASREKLVEFLKKFFPGARIESAYEAGFSGFGLHRYLLANGINNRVVHAASIEVSARDKVKTDKRDALKIATQLADGRLAGIHVPSEEREAKRSITRLRESFMKARQRVGNQLKSLLYLHDLIAVEDERKVSKKWLEAVLKYEVHSDVGYCIQMYVEQWLDLQKKINGIDKRLEIQAREDADLELIYRSAPGIGEINARQLANELGDMKQFSNEKKLYSFTGLTPSEHSSGEHTWKGHITHQGRSVIRKTLTQAAWVAIKKDTGLNKIFERIAEKAGKRRAIIAIARRLIGRIRSCFLNGCLYETGKA